MSWSCSGSSNKQLVQNMFNAGILKSKSIVNAMTATDRACYVTKENLRRAYEDRPLGIGFNATISAPHMHAYGLENLLQPIENAKNEGRVPQILDVGCGSGYLLGAFSRIHESRVVGLEHIQGLYDMSVRNLKKDIEQSGDSDLSNRIEIHHCDGRLGWPQESTDPIYDVIHVGAAAPEIPKHFFNQLRNGGRLILPVGPKGGSQVFQQWDKDQNGSLSRHDLMGVIYIPLTDAEDQLRDY